MIDLGERAVCATCALERDDVASFLRSWVAQRISVPTEWGVFTLVALLLAKDPDAAVTAADPSSPARVRVPSGLADVTPRFDIAFRQLHEPTKQALFHATRSTWEHALTAGASGLAVALGRALDLMRRVRANGESPEAIS